MKIEEQERVLNNDKKNMLVSASAGSGKTYIMIKYITQLVCDKKIPISELLVLTFTKAAATEMKERLQKSLKEMGQSQFIVEQIDALSTANISTIHAYCEKCIKKYANLIGISENFSIADENISNKLKQTAFENALNRFQEEENDLYNSLLGYFKNDKAKIRNVLFEFEVLANSIADKELYIDKIVKTPEVLFDNAVEFIFDNTKKQLNELLKAIDELHVNDFYDHLEILLNPILQSKDIFEMSNAICCFSFPYLPKRKEVGDEVVEKLNIIKASINKALDKIIELNLLDEENVSYQRNGELEKIVVKLFNFYENEENNLKKMQNLLDFYDLEKYMKILSQKEKLFQGVKFVFVDEYQDTNKVQERIVKNVAKNCNFVAVGDVKQGIYGFRQASSEIFLNDLKTFEGEDDSAVNYLHSNFRSSQKVLDFVNDVFKVCMTEEVAGVDYLNSSMLKGMTKYEDDGQPAITIDLVSEAEFVAEQLPAVYSVKEAKIIDEDKNFNVMMDILKRITEVMQTEIFDGEKLRRCRYSDIAILSRKRDGLFCELENFLQNCSIPVVSTSRSVLQDEPEIKMLINYLKIALVLNDDIALVSVLTSDLCNLTLQELTQLKRGRDESLCQLIFKSENAKILLFLEKLQKFRKNIVIFGIKNAFLELFNEMNYRAKINLKIDHVKLNTFIDKFLDEITSSGFEFDLPGMINYFETVEISVATESTAVEEAVILTTIHNSKGLEYPIVFLIGCDQNLKMGRPKIDVEVDEEFGLALKYYDQADNKEVTSVRMRAIKDSEAEKDFVEELMIFYVALTRAKNRIYLFGKDGDFSKNSIRECDSYYDLIFYSLKNAENQGCVSINKIGPFEKENIADDEDEVVARIVNEEYLRKIDDYINYNYIYDELTNFKLKTSVTALNQKEPEDVLVKYSNENFKFGSSLVDVGNAYHLALKLLDFEKIADAVDLEKQFQINKALLGDVEKLIDKSVLLKNILILKEFSKGAKVYKEKEFMIKEKLTNLLERNEYDDEILVQGVVDFFAIKGKECVLIDYKYTNSTSDEYLIGKYKNQLKVYKMAIENALNLKINEIYLLSLKNSKLINVKL